MNKDNADIKSCLNSGLETVEIATTELEQLTRDFSETYNLIAELLRDSGIVPARDLSRTAKEHSFRLRAALSPIDRLQLLNAYLRQLLAKLRDGLKAVPLGGGGSKAGRVIQVCSKIMSRGIQLIDHLKNLGTMKSGQEAITLDSHEARKLIAGQEGEEPSRRDTIRAMMRAKRLFPSMICSHRPNDGRRTMRILVKQADLSFIPEIDVSFAWQRCVKGVILPL